MKLGLSLRLAQRRGKQKVRTHADQRDKTKPLARQVRQLRRHYDRVAIVAARLEGRTPPRPGLTYKLTLAATMMQTGMTRRQAVDHLLRKLSETRRAEGER